jgi:hypothetical protein
MRQVLAVLSLALATTGCVRMKSDPIRVEPIEITMNVNLRIAQELNEFFDELDAQSEVMRQLPAEDQNDQEMNP